MERTRTETLDLPSTAPAKRSPAVRNVVTHPKGTALRGYPNVPEARPLTLYTVRVVRPPPGVSSHLQNIIKPPDRLARTWTLNDQIERSAETRLRATAAAREENRSTIEILERGVAVTLHGVTHEDVEPRHDARSTASWRTLLNHVQRRL